MSGELRCASRRSESNMGHTFGLSYEIMIAIGHTGVAWVFLGDRRASEIRSDLT